MHKIVELLIFGLPVLDLTNKLFSTKCGPIMPKQLCISGPEAEIQLKIKGIARLSFLTLCLCFKACTFTTNYKIF